MIPFRLADGRRIDLLHPQVTDVDVPTVACGLSKICRFNGQLSEFYSVAEHSLNVSFLVPPRFRFAALHHDDTEAYLGDVSRHLKHSEYMAGYRRIEERWQWVVDRALDLSAYETGIGHQEIKLADDVAAIFERQVLQLKRPWHPHLDIHDALYQGFVSGGPDRSPDLIETALRCPRSWFRWPYVPLSPRQAERVFLQRHSIYGAERHA